MVSLGEDPLLVGRWLVSCNLTWQRVRELPGVSYKDTDPFHEMNYLLKDLPPSIILGIRFHLVKFEGTQTFRHSTCYVCIFCWHFLLQGPMG